VLQINLLLVVQHFVFPAWYRRLSAASRFGLASAVLCVVAWLACTWGDALPLPVWLCIGGLAVAACVPLIVNRTPHEMELMWRARLKEGGEPGPPVWQVRLKTGKALRNALLLWSWPLGERVLVIGVARGGWCPQLLVLLPPWFAARQLRRTRSLLRLGPPPAASGASGVS
jgi:multisubunit Na+/H+ antiporter MnhG subunit